MGMEAPHKPYVNPTQTAWLPNANPMQIARNMEHKQYGNFLKTPTVLVHVHVHVCSFSVHVYFHMYIVCAYSWTKNKKCTDESQYIHVYMDVLQVMCT